MRLHGRDLRHGFGDRLLDLARDRVRVLEREVCGQLQVQRDLGAGIGSEHREIVDLPHLRHALRRGKRALA